MGLRKEAWARETFCKWRDSHFRVLFIFVDTELEVAQKRVQARYEATGRPVQPEFVVTCHRDSRHVARVAEQEQENFADLFVRIHNNKDGDPDISPADAEKIKHFCFGETPEVSPWKRCSKLFKASIFD